MQFRTVAQQHAGKNMHDHIWDHSFSMYAKFYKKLPFSYSLIRTHLGVSGGEKMPVYRKILGAYQMNDPSEQQLFSSKYEWLFHKLSRLSSNKTVVLTFKHFRNGFQDILIHYRQHYLQKETVSLDLLGNPIFYLDFVPANFVLIYYL